MIRQEPQNRNRQRNVHRRRNAFHAPMTEATRVQLEIHIAERTIDFICMGQPVDVDALAYEGAKKRIREMLTPFHLAIILKQRVMAEEKVDVYTILSLHPKAYDMFVVYLTPAEKAKLGIRICDEATLRQRCEEREQEQLAAHDAFARAEVASCEPS